MKNNLKCLIITGAAGFVGSNLSEKLYNKYDKVLLVDNLKYGRLDNLPIELQPKLVIEDIRTIDWVNVINSYFDTNENLVDLDVIHLAGISALPECESNPYDAWNVNTASVSKLLDSLRFVDVKLNKFIFSSTSALYENTKLTDSGYKETDEVNPDLTYASTKLAAEQICKQYKVNYGMPIYIVRFFNVYGPHQDFLRKNPPFTSYLAKCFANNVIPTIYNTDPNVKRDYLYVDDLMHYMNILLSKEYDAINYIFNFTSGEAVSTIDILNMFKKIMNLDNIVYDSGDPVAIWNSYQTMFNQKCFNLSLSRVKKEVYKSCLGDNSKLKELDPDYKFTDMKTGLTAVLQYQKDYMKNKK